jgi:hypothetical protein
VEAPAETKEELLEPGKFRHCSYFIGVKQWLYMPEWKRRMGTPCCNLGGQQVVLPLWVYILFCFGLLSMQGDIKKIYAIYILLKAVHLGYILMITEICKTIFNFTIYFLI